MKNLKRILILVCLVILFNCDNDDGNNPNVSQCVNAGITWTNPSGTVNTFIADNDLKTEYFVNNGGPNIPGIEVGSIQSPADYNFITDVLTANTTGTGSLIFNGTFYGNLTVTCLRTGSSVGDELLFDVVDTANTGAEFEICVAIDFVLP